MRMGKQEGMQTSNIKKKRVHDAYLKDKLARRLLDKQFGAHSFLLLVLHFFLACMILRLLDGCQIIKWSLTVFLVRHEN